MEFYKFNKDNGKKSQNLIQILLCLALFKLTTALQQLVFHFDFSVAPSDFQREISKVFSNISIFVLRVKK